MTKKINNIHKNIVSIDIGGNSLKVVYGDCVKDHLEIKKAFYIPVPEGVIVDGELVNVEPLSVLLKDLLKQHQIHSKTCFSCFESQQIITREVVIPSVDKSNLQDMARFEVEQFLPVELTNYVIQSLILKEFEIDDKPFAEMIVTAFPKKIIDQLHKMIVDAGLKPLVLDTGTNAFSKLVENQNRINGNDYHKDSTTAFIDFGYEHVDISIFQKNKFRFSRVIKVGGRDIDNNIAKFLDISIEEAAKKKLGIKNINYTVDEMDEEARINNIIKSTMSNWLDEISKVFRYYSAKSQSTSSIEYVYIYGGGSRINGLSDFLQSFFKVPVEHINKISSVSLQEYKGVKIDEMLTAFGSMYRRQV